MGEIKQVFERSGVWIRHILHLSLFGIISLLLFFPIFVLVPLPGLLSKLLAIFCWICVAILIKFYLANKPEEEIAIPHQLFLSPRTSRYWSMFAKYRGLTFEAHQPNRGQLYILQGNYRNYALHTESTLTSLERHTIIKIFFPQPLGEGLHIYPELKTTNQLLTDQSSDIIVGDEQFDTTFVVKAGDNGLVQKRLSPLARSCLLRLWQQHESRDQFALFDDRLVYRLPRFIENPEDILSLVDRMVDTVSAVVENRGNLSIRSVRRAERCEICHQIDEFDLALSYCQRCDHTSN
ncbi:MAG: hypothetical protein AB1489_39025 [Acidobacteriota bacterium]